MSTIRFERMGEGSDGAALYRLLIDGKPAREGLTMDEVIRIINRRDEESLGARHGRQLWDA